VGDGALDVPFGEITHNCCIIDAKLFSGDIVVISYNNSVGQEISGCRISVSLRTEISPSPYRYSGKFYRHKIAPLGLSLLH
ncbi:hypothetical protein, partial [Ruminococcus bicirculans (ex Wegman et al. 2014)]|uniref:hypothetical protein n=1 Tax=Ruminococcus bicirculans (ex Wegman et al. 2014) TaxID=1160721 RepID=UPI003FD7F48D